MIKQYEGEKFEDLKGLYLIDFYADWCGPCRMLGIVLEELEGINILKVNVEEFEDLAKEYKVMSIPYLLLIKDGKVQKELLGFRSKEDLEKEISVLL